MRKEVAMTSRGTWKKAESKVAKFFGTTRTPLSGSNSRHTGSDTLHPELYVENKYRASHSVVKLYDETAAAAKREGKLPMVTLEVKNRPGFWIVLKADDFGKLLQILGYEKKK